MTPESTEGSVDRSKQETLDQAHCAYYFLTEYQSLVFEFEIEIETVYRDQHCIL